MAYDGTDVLLVAASALSFLTGAFIHGAADQLMRRYVPYAFAQEDTLRWSAHEFAFEKNVPLHIQKRYVAAGLLCGLASLGATTVAFRAGNLMGMVLFSLASCAIIHSYIRDLLAYRRNRESH